MMLGVIVLCVHARGTNMVRDPLPTRIFRSNVKFLRLPGSSDRRDQAGWNVSADSADAPPTHQVRYNQAYCSGLWASCVFALTASIIQFSMCGRSIQVVVAVFPQGHIGATTETRGGVAAIRQASTFSGWPAT